MEEVAREYVEAFWELYEPRRLLDRTYRHYRVLAGAPVHKAPTRGPPDTAPPTASVVLKVDPPGRSPSP